jgi:hypothetical protein
VFEVLGSALQLRRCEMHEVERAFRREAMEGAKLAVRAYARDPSAEHAREVAEAWRQVRRMEALAGWRRAPLAQVGSPSSTKRGLLVRAEVACIVGSDARG